MPAARPRVLTPRLTVVALVLVIVLSVMSVPLASVAMHYQAQRIPRPGSTTPVFALAEYFNRDGHLIVVARRDFATGTVWEACSGPEGDAAWLFAMALATPNAQRVEHDARPRSIRTPLDGEEHIAVLRRAGWPLEVAEGIERWLPDGTGVDTSLWKPVVFGQTWVVPLGPVWGGLLANALFYATLLLSPFVLWRWWRMRRRETSGRCVACGYKLGSGVIRCPECGLAVEMSPA